MPNLLEKCVLCGHRCGINRIAGQLGKCRAGIKPKVASFCAHHGEEPMISGKRGSGTIFFSHCSLKCVYCQNYAILAQARKQGLKLPIVYNTGGYDSLELLKALNGKIDIYIPDLKYFDDEKALKYSGCQNYVEAAKVGIAEMYRQSKILVRHLVLPNALSDSKKVLDFLAGLSKDIRVSIMAQYSPQYRAKEYPELARTLRPEEYQQIVMHAQALGLHNLYIQELESREVYLPDFSKETPFKVSGVINGQRAWPQTARQDIQ